MTFSTKNAAVMVKKTLDSAIANAENNHGADIDELKVSTIYIDQGPTLKRINPRARGRADRISNRSCHITVKVSEMNNRVRNKMGQKVNPIGIRLGIINDWTSTWYAESGNYADFLHADIAARKYISEDWRSGQ